MSDIQVNEKVQVYTAQVIGQYQMFMNMIDNKPPSNILAPIQNTVEPVITEPKENPKLYVKNQDLLKEDPNKNDNDITKMFTDDIDDLERFYSKYDRTDDNLLDRSFFDNKQRANITEENSFPQQTTMVKEDTPAPLIKEEPGEINLSNNPGPTQFELQNDSVFVPVAGGETQLDNLQMNMNNDNINQDKNEEDEHYSYHRKTMRLPNNSDFVAVNDFGYEDNDNLQSLDFSKFNSGDGNIQKYIDMQKEEEEKRQVYNNTIDMRLDNNTGQMFEVHTEKIEERIDVIENKEELINEQKKEEFNKEVNKSFEEKVEKVKTPVNESEPIDNKEELVRVDDLNEVKDVKDVKNVKIEEEDNKNDVSLLNDETPVTPLDKTFEQLIEEELKKEDSINLDKQENKDIVKREFLKKNQGINASNALKIKKEHEQSISNKSRSRKSRSRSKNRSQNLSRSMKRDYSKKSVFSKSVNKDNSKKSVFSKSIHKDNSKKSVLSKSVNKDKPKKSVFSKSKSVSKLSQRSKRSKSMGRRSVSKNPKKSVQSKSLSKFSKRNEDVLNISRFETFVAKSKRQNEIDLEIAKSIIDIYEKRSLNESQLLAEANSIVNSTRKTRTSKSVNLNKTNKEKYLKRKRNQTINKKDFKEKSVNKSEKKSNKNEDRLKLLELEQEIIFLKEKHEEEIYILKQELENKHKEEIERVTEEIRLKNQKRIQKLQDDFDEEKEELELTIDELTTKTEDLKKDLSVIEEREEKLENEKKVFDEEKENEYKLIRQYKDIEMKKIRREKKIIERNKKVMENSSNKKDKEEIESLKAKLKQMEEENIVKEKRMKVKVKKLSKGVEEQETRIKELEEENNDLKTKEIELNEELIEINEKLEEYEKAKMNDIDFTARKKQRSIFKKRKAKKKALSLSVDDELNGEENSASKKLLDDIYSTFVNINLKARDLKIFIDEKNYRYNTNNFYLKFLEDDNGPRKVVTTKTLPDGKEQKIYENGSYDLFFKNSASLRRTVYPNDYTIVQFTNGDIRQILPDKTVLYYYKDQDTTQISVVKENMEVYRFSEGQVEFHYKNGNKEIKFPTGAEKYVYPNGEEITLFNDGSYQCISVDKIKLVHFADGTRTIDYPDGKVVSIDEEGNVVE